MSEQKLYSGTAEIVEVVPEDLREFQTKGMTPEDAANAFNIRYKVKTPEGDYLNVEVEISKRELKGRMLEIYAQRVKGRQPTQMDVSLAQLKRQGLITNETEDCIAEAISEQLVGRKVNVAQKEGGLREDGTRYEPRTYFASGPARIAGNELAARIARLTGKPAPAVPKKQEDPAPAPAEAAAQPDDAEDPDALPF